MFDVYKLSAARFNAVNICQVCAVHRLISTLQCNTATLMCHTFHTRHNNKLCSNTAQAETVVTVFQCVRPAWAPSAGGVRRDLVLNCSPLHCSTVLCSGGHWPYCTSPYCISTSLHSKQLCTAVPVKWPALCLNYQLLGARYADERDVGGMGRGETKGRSGGRRN